jgi:transposase
MQHEALQRGADRGCSRKVRSAVQYPENSNASQGQRIIDAIIGVSEGTYYRWYREFRGLKSEQVKRLKDLELENSRLRKAGFPI